MQRVCIGLLANKQMEAVWERKKLLFGNLKNSLEPPCVLDTSGELFFKPTRVPQNVWILFIPPPLFGKRPNSSTKSSSKSLNLVAILSAILLIIQQYCWQYCWSALLLATLPAILLAILSATLWIIQQYWARSFFPRSSISSLSTPQA